MQYAGFFGQRVAFFGQIFLVAICLNYAVRLSQLTLQVKNLVQEVAVLRAELEDATARALSAPRPPA